MSEDSQNSLFEEKYRPRTVADVKGNDNHKKQLLPQIERVKEAIRNIQIENGNLAKTKDPQRKAKILKRMKRLKNTPMRHQLFSGNPGVGKTTMAMAIGRDIFGPSYAEMFHEFNASDQRGIDVVREEIRGLSEEGSGEFPFQIIFLDEIDNMTDDAQMALKRIIEKARHTMFIGACNSLEDVIGALQSRFTVRKMRNISLKVAVDMLEYICQCEGIDHDDKFLEELYLTRTGDMRACVGKLGEYKDLHQRLTVDMIDEGKLRKEDVKAFFKECIKGMFRKAFRFYQRLRIENSVSQNDFYESLEKYILRLSDKCVQFKAKVFTYAETFVGKRESDAMVLALIGTVWDAEQLQKSLGDDAIYEPVAGKAET